MNRTPSFEKEGSRTLPLFGSTGTSEAARLEISAWNDVPDDGSHRELDRDNTAVTTDRSTREPLQPWAAEPPGELLEKLRRELPTQEVPAWSPEPPQGDERFAVPPNALDNVGRQTPTYGTPLPITSPDQSAGGVSLPLPPSAPPSRSTFEPATSASNGVDRSAAFAPPSLSTPAALQSAVPSPATSTPATPTPAAPSPATPRTVTAPPPRAVPPFPTNTTPNSSVSPISDVSAAVSPSARRPEEVVRANGAAGRTIEGQLLRFSVPTDGTLQFLPGRLEISSGLDAGREIRFVRVPGPNGTEVTFGRSEGELYRHVQLLDQTVSRTHARLRFKDDRWCLFNLSKTNPVVLDGKVLGTEEDHLLEDGARIEMGEVVFTFRNR